MVRPTSKLSYKGAKLRQLVKPACYWVCLVASVGLLELVGRRSPSDNYDLLGVLAIVTILKITASLPRAYVPWRSSIAYKIRSQFQALKNRLEHTIGLDFRSDSPQQTKSIPAFKIISICCWGLAAALVPLKSYFPDQARELLLAISPTFYFSAIGSLWSVYVLGLVIAMIVCFILTHDFLVRRDICESVQKRKRLAFAITAATPLLLLGIGCLVGLQYGIWLSLAALLLAQLFPIKPEGKPLIALVKNQSGELYSVPFTSFIRQANTWVACGILVLGILAGGGEWGDEITTQWTRRFGSTFLWVSSPLFILLLVRGLSLFWSPAIGSASPTEARCKSIWLIGNKEDLRARGVDIQAVSDLIEKAGWSFSVQQRAPRRDECDIAIALDESYCEEASAEKEIDGLAPPVILLTLEELSASALTTRLERWDHVWKRRRLYKRISRLFKVASSRTYQKGTGFLFMPHYWFVPGLTRDEEEEALNYEDSSDGCIGPSYKKLLGKRLRRYLREVFDAVEIDLIYIEDGVGYRGLKKVLSSLFEVYDIHGGEMRAEDHHFTGIPGLHVQIDDYGLANDALKAGDQSGSSSEDEEENKYPEPDYDCIGRARILVIQKERGGGDEEDELMPPIVDEEEEYDWLRKALEGVGNFQNI